MTLQADWFLIQQGLQYLRFRLQRNGGAVISFTTSTSVADSEAGLNFYSRFVDGSNRSYTWSAH